MTTNTTIRIVLSVALVVGGVAFGAAACDDSSAVKEQLVDAGTPTIDSGTSGGDAGEKDCFDNPQTHFEIINACTTAVRIDKNPKLNKLLPDGGLPPLD
jgi:hypothetical protein